MANHIECANCGNGLSSHDLYYHCPGNGGRWFEEKQNMDFYWWNKAIHKKSYRNDFMSHGSYVFMLTMLTMFVTGLFGGTVWWMGTIGALTGLAATILREVWDEYSGGKLEPLDIVAGMLAVTLAEAVLIILTGGV